MELRQLKYFLAIAEEGQITKAAKRLQMTQPPLSQQMLLLEKELGVTLFRRTKKHIYLTESGEALRHRAGQLMELLQITSEEVRETTTGLRGKLTIGIINSSGRLLLPEVVHSFHQQYPHVTFNLRQTDSRHIEQLLDSHLIDLGFVRSPIDSQRYESISIPPENMVMVAKKDLFPSKKNAELKDLGAKPLLIHRRYESTIIDYFHQHNQEASIFCTSDEMLPLLSWALLGLGIAIVPEFSIHLVSNPDLVIQKITKPVVKDNSALIWRKNETLPKIATHFITLFQEHIK